MSCNDSRDTRNSLSRMIGDKSGQSTLEYAVVLFAFLAMVVTLTTLWQAVHSGLFIESATHALSPEFSKTLKDVLLY